MACNVTVNRTLRRCGAMALGVLLLSGVGAARGWSQSAIEHASVYTRAPMDAALPPPARSPMRLVSPKLLPLSAILSTAGAPQAPLRPGAAAGSLPAGSSGQAQVRPDSYGNYSELSIAPYSMSRASADMIGVPPKTASQVGVTSYPWRATGKLYFNIGGAAYVCSASLIKPGLLVTAAHCVFEFGQGASGWHTDFVFAPAQYVKGKAPPYGTWTAVSELVTTTYANGKDTCVTAGVVCNNDIAIITIAPNSAGKLPGTVVGWYGYGWNGYSSVLSFGGAQLSAITQLGYPVAFDGGLMMERNDGIGALWQTNSLKNTVLGSAMTGGSSGGPWLVNFGASPVVDTNAASLGTSSVPDIVVGVTSWGYLSVGANTQGASTFGIDKEFTAQTHKDKTGVDRGAGNIGYLVMTACNAHPKNC